MLQKGINNKVNSEINQLFEFIEKVDEPHYKQLPK